MRVDLAEIKQSVRLPELDGLPNYKFAASFGITDVAAAALMKAGVIKSITAVNPVNRSPVTIVTSEHDAELRRDLISLRDLARERNVNSRRLLRELEAVGITPVAGRTSGRTFPEKPTAELTSESRY